MNTNKRKIIFCPNCGKLVEAKEYYSLQGFSMGIAGTPNPVNNRILCEQCNYGGLPIETTFEDFKKIDFSKWDVLAPPIQNASANYKFLAKTAILIFIIIFSVLAFSAFGPFVSVPIIVLAGIWFWKSA